MNEIRTQFKAALDADDPAELRRVISQDPQSTEALLSEVTVLGPWLSIAAEKNCADIVNALLEHGANPNLKHKRSQANALDAAAGKGRLGILKILHSAGAEFEISTAGTNPLFSAIYGQSLPVVEYLLNAGIDATVDYEMAKGVRYDAVSFALERGEREIASLIALHVAKGDPAAAQAHLDRGWDAVKRANPNANPDNVPKPPVLTQL